MAKCRNEQRTANVRNCVKSIRIIFFFCHLNIKDCGTALMVFVLQLFSLLLFCWAPFICPLAFIIFSSMQHLIAGKLKKDAHIFFLSCRTSYLTFGGLCFVSFSLQFSSSFCWADFHVLRLWYRFYVIIAQSFPQFVRLLRRLFMVGVRCWIQYHTIALVFFFFLLLLLPRFYFIFSSF